MYSQAYSATFDLMMLFLIIVIAQNLIFLYFLNKGALRKSIKNKVSSLFIIVATLNLTNVYFLKFSELTLPNLGVVFGLLYGPLLLYFIRASLVKNYKPDNSFLIHISPSLVILFLLVFKFIPQINLFMAIAIILHFGAYLIAGMFTLGSFNHTIKKEKTKIEIPDTSWLWHILIVLSVIFISILAESVLVKPRLRFYFSILVIISGYSYLILRYIFLSLKKMYIYFKLKKNPDHSASNAIIEKYKGSLLSKEKSKALADHLTQIMSINKPYLEDNITLNDLSKLLNTHSRYLSQAINENFQCNFFDYINSYRVKDAKEMLSNPLYANHKIYEIMYAVGFQSRSSFNHAIKKETGLSPKEYRDKFKLK